MSRISPKIKKEVIDFINNSYKEMVYVITPTSLKKAALLKCKPPHIEDEVWIQNCRWIIHSIIQLSFEKKRYNNKAGNYIPLNSKIIQQNCGNGYHVYIEGLMESKIIECDLVYSKIKHKSFGFKIADKYSSSPLKHITLTENFLVKRIRKYRAERIEKLKLKSAPIAHLVRWITYDNLKIDKIAALEFLETYKRKLTNELSKRNLKKYYLNKQEAFVLRRYYKIKYQIENWETNNHISIDDSGGRLYSPITGIPSLFRNFLTYDDDELIGFDIKNSQPLHFLSMLKKEFWLSYTSNITLKRLDKDLFRYLKSEDNFPPYIMLQESAESIDSRWFINYTFKKLVQNGKLYEFICSNFYNKYFTKGKIDRFNTRAKTKQEFLHMMYFDPKTRYSTARAVFNNFKAFFPEEAAIMNLMKKRKHNDFPIILQKIEAQMLLHKVAKKVYDLNADIPLFTIHDSIITTKKHASKLLSILEEEYKKFIGFIPQFEKTIYSEGNAFNEITKYTKSKVDQAEIEISENGIICIPVQFWECEHWDFDINYKKFLTQKKLSVIPDFANYVSSFPALKQKSYTVNTFKKLKK